MEDEYKKRLKSARVVALIMSAITIISLTFLVYAFMQKAIADQNFEEARIARESSRECIVEMEKLKKELKECQGEIPTAD